MSAAPQIQAIANSFRRYSELETTREIGRIASQAVELESVLEDIVQIALHTPGITRLQIEHAPGLLRAGSAHSFLEDVAGPMGHAVASISAHGITHGKLRTLFDFRNHHIEEHLRFTRFLAQQIACLVNRIQLSRRGDLLAKRIETFRRRLQTRKAVNRAIGLLAHRRGISQRRAFCLLCAQARKFRCNLLSTAELVIFHDLEALLERPSFQRLGPAELTNITAKARK